MEKEKIQEMADLIDQVKMFINPSVMRFTKDEWTEVLDNLKDRHSTLQGGSIITDAMGGDSVLVELKARFQVCFMEAMYSYVMKLYEANDLAKEIEEHKSSKKDNLDILKKAGLL